MTQKAFIRFSEELERFINKQRKDRAIIKKKKRKKEKRTQRKIEIVRHELY